MVRKLSKIRELERHRLSDGGLAIITVFKRKYGFCRTSLTDQAPEVTLQLTKDQAYTMLEECLKKDVLEVDS